jgi:hypothetical protein
VTPDEPVAEPPGRLRAWSARPQIARIGRLAGRARITSPALQALLALAAYLAVWMTTRALPLVQHPSWAQFDQASMDPNFYTWSLRWWPYAIAHGFNPLYSTEIGAPAGHALAWVTTIPPIALLASPLTAAAGPVVSFNLLVGIALPVSAWAAFVLCRRITHRFWPALVGGAVYGFSAYEMNHAAAGQLNLIFSLMLPLMAYLVVLWWDGKINSPVFVGLLAVAMALQFYLFLETFADMTAVWVVALLLGFALAGRPGRPAVARLGWRVALAYLFALVLAGPYLDYALTHVPGGFVHTSGLDLASLVVPRPGHTFRLSWLTSYARRPAAPSAEGYAGIPLLAIAVLLAAVTWSRKIVRLLSVLLVIVILAALGPSLVVGGQRVVKLPWARIWNLPIVRSAFPARFVVFAFLILAVMTALWLAGPSRRLWLRWPLAALAIAAMIFDTPTLQVLGATDVPKFISSGEYRHFLAPGDTVAVVSTGGNAGMLWQAETGFYMKLAGGYINAALTARTDLPQPIQNLSHATPASIGQFRVYIRKAKIAAILVDISSEPKWVGILSKFGFQTTAIFGVRVYSTGQASRSLG